jgi:hypothetical protein
MNMQILTTFVELAVLISALVLLIMFVDAKARKRTQIEPLDDERDSVLDRDAIERERRAIVRLSQQRQLKRGPQGFQRRATVEDLRNELATALSKAQGEMNDAAKSSANPAPQSSIPR